MKIIAVVILILIVLYTLDKIICLMYCRMKEKQTGRGLSKPVVKDTGGSGKDSRINHGIKRLLLGWMMYSVMRLGRVPCQKYRVFVLKYIYRMKIAKRVVVYGNFKIRAPWNISVGEGTVIGDGCQLDGRNGLEIGRNVNLSSDVYIYTEQHDVDDPDFESRESGGRVVVGDRVWLSSRTTVLPKVKIGEGAVLASGALANRDLEAFSIYVGIPAEKIKERSRDLRYEFNGDFIPFY